MIDTPNFQNPINPETGRRLKKVKRPIKRIPPQGGNFPAAPSPFLSQENRSSARRENESFEFDTTYLDENNLPTIANQMPENSSQETPHFINEEEIYDEHATAPSFFDGVVAKKVALVSVLAAFLVGIVLSKLIFSEEKVVRDGLQGVVVNSEVPRGRARCGVAEKTQGCVLYIMNPQRQELAASDFYDLAAQLTGRQRFIIETGNMRYSNRKIKPGEIAQFNIPPLQ